MHKNYKKIVSRESSKESDDCHQELVTLPSFIQSLIPSFDQIFSNSFVLVVLVQSLASYQVFAEEPSSFEKLFTPTFQQYCGQCHGKAEELEGDLNLLTLTSESLTDNLELVQSLINVIDLQEMPPEDEPQPSLKLRESLIAELRKILRSHASSPSESVRTPIRRINRFQYNNAVIDLFELKSIVFTLPERMLREHNNYFQPASGKMADVVAVGSRPLGKSQLIEKRLAGVAAFPQDLRAEHGFDNRADHLSLSPLLMEAFLNLGQSITQSPDFVPKNVGNWNSFFKEPEKNTNLSDELRNRIKPFLTRAFRRSVEEAVLDRYVRFAIDQINSGTNFTDAMKAVAAATISSPMFLYLYDTQPENHVAIKINDYELASRLSFFLWGSLPDQQLLDLAARGELNDAETLTTQVDRMLHDKKLKRFCDSFPSQWLQLERIISSVPNREKYPEFYFSKYRDSMHMMLEPLLLFETVLIEDLPITQLIDSDFTYRSGLLEDAYGELKSDAKGSLKSRGSVGVLNFHRVPLKDRRVGGVITNAAVMTMTSGPERTQPITRGAWLATAIFNDPPEPPPADVPPLGEKPAAGEENLTLRERLSLHRKRSDCKGCHEQIDPLGFALENFSPIGTWRNQYENGRDVDMSGALFRQHEFNDVVQFKDAILTEKHRFTQGLAGHLLSFALARELNAADHVAIENIANETAADGFKMQTLLKQIIFSEPFQSQQYQQVLSD